MSPPKSRRQVLFERFQELAAGTNGDIHNRWICDEELVQLINTTHQLTNTVTAFNTALSFHCGFANDRYRLPNNNNTTVFTNKYYLKNEVSNRCNVRFYYIDTQTHLVVTKQTKDEWFAA